MRAYLIILLLAVFSTTAQAQRPELNDKDVVRDSVSAAIHRELADGLWQNAIAAGDLKGSITMDFVIDDKGRVETVFTTTYTVPVQWKNIIQDYWMDHRFGFKLAKAHKEKVAIELTFP